MATRAKIAIQNEREAPHVVYIEPWGGDFTLMPGEELEVVAFGGQLMPRLLLDVQPFFAISESEGATQVFCEDAADYKVMQDGRELKVGHQRQPGMT